MTQGMATGLALTAACAAALCGCGPKQETRSRTLGFDAFVPQYNRHIREWLATRTAEVDAEIRKTNASRQTATGAAAADLDRTLAELTREREKLAFRTGIGDYLRFGTEQEVPADLAWERGMDEPEIGDPAARKGGVFRKFMETFPPTIRPFGDNSNNSFRGELYDTIEMPLVGLHPQTMRLIPALANEWAVSADGRTVFFRVDPEARYSDGRPVRARDFAISLYLRASDFVVNPYAKQYYREEVAGIGVYGERTVSVTLPEAKYLAPAVAGGLTPSSPDFYAEYGPDYTERYQWRFPPTTGAYEVLPQDIVKGVSITQTRVRNWWARDRKYYRHRFNPDKIVHTVVRDESKAFELFRAGRIDTFFLTRPEYWYEKSETEPVYRGFIERVTFYNRYPKVPRGLYLNVVKPPLDNRDVRVGIDHAMNWRKVIDQLFRGDYQRLNAFNEGYVEFSDPSITARPFSIPLAREAFAKAGFTEEGPDGILRRPDGTRLSVAVTYPAMPMSDRIFAILREECRPCGLELRLDGLEFTVAYKKMMQKQHEITLGSWLIGPPVPDFHQFLHSTNARDPKGNIRPQTNNIFSWAREDTDRLSEAVRSARSAGELRDAAWKLQHIMREEAIFLPGYSVDFVRLGSWRWVRWPDCNEMRFSPPVVFDPHESFVFWIDEEKRRETEAARRGGGSFPESTRVIDVYRQTPAAGTSPGVTPETTDEGP
jgi:microcin C transport system substrate-binding protein